MYADLLDKGYTYLRRGDPESALVRFQHAAQSEPELPQAHFGAAIAYLELDSSKEVMDALETALRVEPTYVPARVYLAIEFLKRYDLDRAQEELEHALHDEPTNLLTHVKYAEYYYRLGFYNRSVELLERGLKGPHGANEHIVAMARQFLNESRQKSKNIILREPPHPRRLLRLLSWLRPQQKGATHVPGKVELS